jgi:uridine kinase
MPRVIRQAVTDGEDKPPSPATLHYHRHMFSRRAIGQPKPLASLIQVQPTSASPVALVGIDGPGGAGKSSLCAALAALDSRITIVHMDDFFVPPDQRTPPVDEVGRQIDWRRVIEQVVAPLANGKRGRYQRFDWDSQALEEWHDVPATGIVLLDGVYSTREEIAPFLDQRTWVSVARDLGIERGIDRDGEESRDWWYTDWLEDEDRYILTERPEDLADVVIDGTNGQEHYDRGEFLRLR